MTQKYPVIQKHLVIQIPGTKVNLKQIAEQLLKEQIATCVKIIPVETCMYQYKGKIETETNSHLGLFEIILKKKSLPQILEMIEKLHIDEVPCIIATSILDMNKKAKQYYLL